MLTSMQCDKIERFCELAGEIWREHYPPIIGSDQVEYMLRKFQSPEAVKAGMDEGYRYYFIFSGNEMAGYLCFKLLPETLFLSKLYIKKEFRGQGLAKDSIKKLAALCRMNGRSSIELTVNKNNHGSIAAYSALGFTELRRQVVDIGGGYVMDDLVLTLKV